MQKQNFEENKGFERSFLRIEVQVISNPSIRLKKHQTSKFLLINNLLWLFLKKMLIFYIFRFFSKIIIFTYLNHCMRFFM